MSRALERPTGAAPDPAGAGKPALAQRVRAGAAVTSAPPRSEQQELERREPPGHRHQPDTSRDVARAYSNPRQERMPAGGAVIAPAAQGPGWAAAAAAPPTLLPPTLLPTAAGPGASSFSGGNDPHALAVRRLEHALTRSGSAAAVAAACKELLAPGAEFAWPLGRVVGRAAVARYFSLLQLLAVDASSVDHVAVAEEGANAVALARLTHRLTPRALEALSPPRLDAAAGQGRSPEAALFFGRGGAPHALASHPPTLWSPDAPLAPSTVPLLRPFVAWLRDRLTFKVINSAVYVFEPTAAPAAGTTTTPPPKIVRIRAEVALVSLVYALPFGEPLWHNVAEPAMGAAAGVLEATWRAFVKPAVAPWLAARGFTALEML